jgi:DNA-binding NarL/FixJ family response regulator
VVLTGLFDTPVLDRATKLGVHSVLLKSKATFEDIRRAVEDAARGGAAA